MKILIVEDENRVADFLSRGLRAERHTVTVASTGEDALELVAGSEFDLIILDLMLPGMHGLEVCQTLRQRRITIPVMILSAMDAVKDRVEGLRLGADDYLTKPFSFDELLARIDALARRPPMRPVEPSRIQLGAFVFDRDTLCVYEGETPIKMTAKELAMLELLLSSPGKIFSRERILNNIWGVNEDPMTNVVDVYIARLRKKLSGPDPSELIETVRGLGYRIVQSG
jgi:DNA-binding response OmpR family regulator